MASVRVAAVSASTTFCVPQDWCLSELTISIFSFYSENDQHKEFNILLCIGSNVRKPTPTMQFLSLILFQLQVCTGWLLATAGFFSAIYGMLPFQQPDYAYNALESSIFNCLHRPIWALAIGWVIYACVSGYGGEDKIS